VAGKWHKARFRRRFPLQPITVRLIDRCLTILSENTPEGWTALIAGPEYVEARWLLPVMQTIPAERLSVLLQDADGNPVNAQAPVESGRRSVRLASDTGLPWTVVRCQYRRRFGKPTRSPPAGACCCRACASRRLFITTGYALTRSLFS